MSYEKHEIEALTPSVVLEKINDLKGAWQIQKENILADQKKQSEILFPFLKEKYSADLDFINRDILEIKKIIASIPFQDFIKKIDNKEINENIDLDSKDKILKIYKEIEKIINSSAQYTKNINHNNHPEKFKQNETSKLHLSKDREKFFIIKNRIEQEGFLKIDEFLHKQFGSIFKSYSFNNFLIELGDPNHLIEQWNELGSQNQQNNNQKTSLIQAIQSKIEKIDVQVEKLDQEQRKINYISHCKAVDNTLTWLLKKSNQTYQFAVQYEQNISNIGNLQSTEQEAVNAAIQKRKENQTRLQSLEMESSVIQRISHFVEQVKQLREVTIPQIDMAIERKDAKEIHSAVLLARNSYKELENKLNSFLQDETANKISDGQLLAEVKTVLNQCQVEIEKKVDNILKGKEDLAKIINQCNELLTDKNQILSQSSDVIQNANALFDLKKAREEIEKILQHNAHYLQINEAIKTGENEAISVANELNEKASQLKQQISQTETAFKNKINTYFSHIETELNICGENLKLFFKKENQEKELQAQVNENNRLLSRWEFISQLEFGPVKELLEKIKPDSDEWLKKWDALQQTHESLKRPYCEKKSINDALKQRIVEREALIVKISGFLNAYIINRNKKYGTWFKKDGEDREQYINTLKEKLNDYATAGNSTEVLKYIQDAKFPGYTLSALLKRIVLDIKCQDAKVPGQYEHIPVQVAASYSREGAQEVLNRKKEHFKQQLNHFYAQIDALKTYGESFKAEDKHGQTAINLAQALDEKVNRFIIENEKLTISSEKLDAFKADFYCHLHSQDDVMSQYTTYEPYIKNISLAFLALTLIFTIPVIVARTAYTYAEDGKVSFFCKSSGLNRVYAIEKSAGYIAEEPQEISQSENNF